MAQASRKSEVGFGANLMRHLKYGLRESAFVLLVGIAAFVVMALLSYQPADPAWTHTGSHDTIDNQGGVIGALLADVMLYFFGYVAFLLPLALLYLAWRLIQADGWDEVDGEIVLFRTLGSGVALAAACGLAALLFEPAATSGSGGGVIGLMVSDGLTRSFGMPGGSLFLLALFLAGFTLATGLSWVGVLDLVGKAAFWSVAALTAVPGRLAELWPARNAVDTPVADTYTDPSAVSPPVSPPSVRVAPPPKPTPASTVRERVEPVLGDDDTTTTDPATDDDLEWFEEDPTPAPSVPPPVRRSAPPKPVPARPAPPPPPRARQPVTVSTSTVESPLPPLDLLDLMETEEEGYPPEELETMSRQVEKLLRDFGVEVVVVAVEPGPVITRFELDPAPGVKVNQISNLTKDLARGLSVMSVRVVEVIPGKSYIGLEIPNQHRQIVYLGEILSAPVYQTSTSPLTLALGKDIGGKPVVANLAKMPHLLVAGTTGSGKSVAINAMLLSLLYKATPDDVRLILIDPKMLELSVYEDIPHLLAPVVTDMKDAANALRWCVAEMERRYRLMAALKVRNIAGYNKQVRAAIEAGDPLPDPLHKPDLQLDPEEEPPILEPLPFIVVVIDELADMMMVVGKKVEELIARLAQKARASGIHLVLATQRPSVDVITGLIKANIPTRIAFQVSSKVDSRTILDQMGAENLLGHGDMLYLPPSSGFLLRVHGAFVDDHEVNRVAEYLKQTGEPDYSAEILDEPLEVPAEVAAFIGGGEGGEEVDPLYDQAVRIVTESRKASISGVQRRLKIGYNRAARMIEEMEAAGIVGPLQSNGGREVLAPPPPDA